MTGLFAICRRRSFRFGLLFAALLFAANGLIHPLFHGGACGKHHRTAVSFTESSRFELPVSVSVSGAGKLHCPVCSGLFSAASPAEPFRAEFSFLPGLHGFPLPDLLLPDALPAACRARAPPFA